jgi:hypothetical protein
MLIQQDLGELRALFHRQQLVCGRLLQVPKHPDRFIDNFFDAINMPVIISASCAPVNSPIAQIFFKSGKFYSMNGTAQG